MSSRALRWRRGEEKVKGDILLFQGLRWPCEHLGGQMCVCVHVCSGLHGGGWSKQHGHPSPAESLSRRWDLNFPSLRRPQGHFSISCQMRPWGAEDRTVGLLSVLHTCELWLAVWCGSRLWRRTGLEGVRGRARSHFSWAGGEEVQQKCGPVVLFRTSLTFLVTSETN